MSEAGAVKHDGEPYLNTENCWAYICEAGKAARYLRLVDPSAFEDHRNPDPVLFASPRLDPVAPSWQIPNPSGWDLPMIETDLAWMLDFRVPDITVTGYDYAPDDQPFGLELWIEKSTMNDVLEPICRELGVNLVTSLGFQSITSIITLLKRIRKPTRIAYVSDFDPAGDGMPTAVARQIEYWLPTYAGCADVKLTPIALTAEQVQTHRLPRIPVKESDRRKGGFEERYGEGAVELDALEALYPGELGTIVREALSPYVDQGLRTRLFSTGREARERASRAWAAATADHAVQLQQIEREASAIAASYEDELQALSTRMGADLEPLKERLRTVRRAVQDAADALTLDLPPRPEPASEGLAEDDWLFDAGREYLDQLAVYKSRTTSTEDGAA